MYKLKKNEIIPEIIMVRVIIAKSGTVNFMMSWTAAATPVLALFIE